jgi:ribose/xylose/arabinose/galactoside ABC-type transport system permease subunit
MRTSKGKLMTQSAAKDAMTTGEPGPPGAGSSMVTRRRGVAAAGRRLVPGRLSVGRSLGIVIALIAVGAYLSVTQPLFLTWDNFTNIVQANSMILVLAIGATFVIIAGGLDLSAASAVVMVSLVFAIALQSGLGGPLSVIIALAAGAGAGLANGFLISYVRISFLVVTLGSLSIFASLALVLDNGGTITTFGLSGFHGIYEFMLTSAGGVPYLLIFDIAIVAIGSVVLRYTAFGRGVFALGSNPEAARLNGINVRLVAMCVYGISGLAAGVASVLSVGRLTAAAPTVDSSLLLTVIAAVLIGGTAYTGGEGGLLGTVIGVLFLGVIQNGLTLSSISPYWRGTVNGLVLIVAVGLGLLKDSRLRSRLRLRAPREEPPGPAPG